MCFDYDGYCDVHEVSHPVARKPHTCCECGQEIGRGVRHQKIVQLYEGLWDTYRICRRCAYLRSRIEQIEISHGCHGAEAVPHLMGLSQYLLDYGLDWRTPVPATFELGGPIEAALGEDTSATKERKS